MPVILIIIITYFLNCATAIVAVKFNIRCFFPIFNFYIIKQFLKYLAINNDLNFIITLNR